MMLRVLSVGAMLASLWWWLQQRLCVVERIDVRAPATAAAVSSPVSVSGFAQAIQHNQLAVRVRDETGSDVGTGSAAVSGPLGARGPFSGTVAYTLGGAAPQHGRIEVYDTSPRDGGLIHLSSVEVTLT